jgi:hypothetical protein
MASTTVGTSNSPPRRANPTAARAEAGQSKRGIAQIPNSSCCTASSSKKASDGAAPRGQAPHVDHSRSRAVSSLQYAAYLSGSAESSEYSAGTQKKLSTTTAAERDDDRGGDCPRPSDSDPTLPEQRAAATEKHTVPPSALASRISSSGALAILVPGVGDSDMGDLHMHFSVDWAGASSAAD